MPQTMTDKNIVDRSRAHKNAAVMKVGNITMNGFFAWIAWLLIHILFLIGFRNKLSVLLGWAYSYIHNNPEARIIVNPPQTP